MARRADATLPPVDSLRIAAGLDPLNNVEVAAERLDTTPGHTRRLIREGKLGHVRVGRFIRVPDSAIARFLDESR
jgi:excisionase family DNA binding protein